MNATVRKPAQDTLERAREARNEALAHIAQVREEYAGCVSQCADLRGRISTVERRAKPASERIAHVIDTYVDTKAEAYRRRLQLETCSGSFGYGEPPALHSLVRPAPYQPPVDIAPVDADFLCFAFGDTIKTKLREALTATLVDEHDAISASKRAELLAELRAELANAEARRDELGREIAQFEEALGV